MILRSLDDHPPIGAANGGRIARRCTCSISLSRQRATMGWRLP